jgi:tRNA1(Val) A37 N6-methylase TrmN6
MSHTKTSFRNWTIPGPVPAAAHGGGPELEDGETLDALSGHWRIFQLKKGHRYSTDDVLTAWYGSSWCPTASTALDLGSGIGSVGMITAWRLPGARFVTVEAQDESVRLARKSADWNGITDRYDIRHGDFRDPDIIAEDETFDLVTGSPPYFPRGTGSEAEHPQKAACRFELRGDIADYCDAAAKHLAPGGFFACVFPIDPPSQGLRVKQAAEYANLTIIRQRPVILRHGNEPLLGLFGMMRKADVPPEQHDTTWEEPPLTIRTQDGSIHPEYAAVKLSFGFPP